MQRSSHHQYRDRRIKEPPTHVPRYKQENEVIGLSWTVVRSLWDVTQHVIIVIIARDTKNCQLTSNSRNSRCWGIGEYGSAYATRHPPETWWNPHNLEWRPPKLSRTPRFKVWVWLRRMYQRNDRPAHDYPFWYPKRRWSTRLVATRAIRTPVSLEWLPYYWDLPLHNPTSPLPV